MIRQAILSASALFCLLASFGLGLWVQEAASPLMMLPFALLSLWLILSGRLLELNLRDPALLGLIALWACWSVSVVHSGFPFNSQVTLLIMSTLPVSLIVWRTAKLDGQWLAGLQGLTLLSGAGLAIWALLQISVLPHGIWGSRASLPFSDPNMLGILFALLLLPVAALIMTRSFSGPLRIATILIFILLIAGLLSTQSRSAFLGALAGLLLCIYLLRERIVWNKNIILSCFAGAIGATAIIASSDFFSRFASLFSAHGDTSLNGRLSIWKSALVMSLEHPFTGYGFGTFSLVYPAYRQAADASAGWWVHMDPLQWAVESGWQTAVIFYALAIYVALSVFRLHRAGTLSPLLAGFSGALLCLFLNAHTAYPLHVIPFMLIATFMIAALCPVQSSAPKTKLVFGCTILLTLLVSLLTLVRTAPTLYYWQQISEARETGDEEQFRNNILNCIEHGNPDFAVCKFLIIETALNSSDRLPDHTRNLIDNARLAHPLLPQPDFYLGLYYLRLPKPEPAMAIQSFRASLAKDPTFFNARRLLVTTLLSEERGDEALAILKKGSDYPVTKDARQFYDYMLEHIQTLEPQP